MLYPVGTPSRITNPSHDPPPLFAIRCSFAFAFASSTLIPTSPNGVLGVSALAGPNIRLQSDRAGSARSLSPRPPSSGIFSERTQTPLTALLRAHYVRHVCMSSDGAQRKSCAVNIQLRKKDRVEIVSCDMRATTRNILFVESVENCCSQRICITLEVVCVNLSPRGARGLFVRDPSNHPRKSASNPRVVGDHVASFQRAESYHVVNSTE